jgi:anti-sigma factor RsiW
MPEPCGRTFDEALLSGYVDDVLTQGDAQRVRIHVEDCRDCRAQVEQMIRVKEATVTSRFALPADEAWGENGRTGGGRLAYGLGWLLVIVWAAIFAAVGLWSLATGPERLVEKLMVFGGLSGFALLFLGVLLDRLSSLKTDRYREVRK